MKTPKSVQEAVEMLERHDQMVSDFYNDPMTSAMGVPTGDFQQDFDKKERKLISFILDATEDGSPEHQMALDRADKFFP